MRERIALNRAEEIHGNLQGEASCPDCGRPRSTNSPVPFPATLAKLQRQHEHILQQVRICRKTMKVTDRIRGRGGLGFGKLTILSFAKLRKLVDEHQREDERVLAPIVDEYLDSSATKNMYSEHKKISQTLRQLNQKLSKIKTSDALGRVILDSATRFEVMAREQFSREENVIYWFASLCLDDRVKRVQTL